MEWEVFRQSKPGGDLSFCGNLYAPDRDMAVIYAKKLFARREITCKLWILPSEEVTKVSEDDVCFGGETNREYRLARGYKDISVDLADDVEVDLEEDTTIEVEGDS